MLAKLIVKLAFTIKDGSLFLKQKAELLFELWIIEVFPPKIILLHSHTSFPTVRLVSIIVILESIILVIPVGWKLRCGPSYVVLLYITFILLKYYFSIIYNFHEITL